MQPSKFSQFHIPYVYVRILLEFGQIGMADEIRVIVTELLWWSSLVGEINLRSHPNSPSNLLYYSCNLQSIVVLLNNILIYNLGNNTTTMGIRTMLFAKYKMHCKLHWGGIPAPKSALPKIPISGKDQNNAAKLVMITTNPKICLIQSLVAQQAGDFL